MKRKDSNCVGILSDQGEAATASKLSEYTIITVVVYQKVHNLYRCTLFNLENRYMNKLCLD